MPESEAVVHWTEALVRLVVATLAGAVIGFNRELTQKPAGLRTHALVSLGSALAVLTATVLGPADDRVHADATARVIQGVVAGIGFIGGGVILHAEGRHIVGLTTAATIWVAAALGVACGVGHWGIAGSAVTIALIVLVVGQWVENLIGRGRDSDTGAPGESARSPRRPAAPGGSGGSGG